MVVFLCDECGQLYSTFLEVPRGYLGDGTISPEMQKEIDTRQTQKEVDKKVKEQMQAMTQAAAPTRTTDRQGAEHAAR